MDAFQSYSGTFSVNVVLPKILTACVQMYICIYKDIKENNRPIEITYFKVYNLQLNISFSQILLDCVHIQSTATMTLHSTTLHTIHMVKMC